MIPALEARRAARHSLRCCKFLRAGRHHDRSCAGDMMDDFSIPMPDHVHERFIEFFKA
jgi:hypothetical protein